MIANLRLILDVEVQAGNQHTSKHSAPGLWALLARLGRARWPALLRGDRDWGTEGNMARAEGEGIDYLFKLRLTKGVKKLVERLMGNANWQEAGQGSQGADSQLRLSGWCRHRRVVMLRRPLAQQLAVVSEANPEQLALGFAEVTDEVKVREYAVQVTSLDEEILGIM